MASGVYGTRIASNITADDVEIFYAYSSTRNSSDVESTRFTKLDSSLLNKVSVEGEDGAGYDSILEGVYNLKLPLQIFSKKGYYSVYIRPKEIPAVISDVGVLSSFPDVKGVVIDTSTIREEDDAFRNKLLANNEIVGYRIEYINPTSGNREDFYRIVTSNNRCEPVVQNIAGSNDKSVRYRYNESASLSFITVSPSSSQSFKPNAFPYIGVSTQKVLFINTKFEPLLIDIEMVDHDIETVTTMLEGNQLRNVENGLVTTFNDENEIYSQHEHFTLKDTATTNPIYEVKVNKKNSIDFTQTINDKI